MVRREAALSLVKPPSFHVTRVGERDVRAGSLNTG